MTLDEITTTLRAFARSKKSGCRACPEYNDCGRIGCRMADEAANLIEMQAENVATLNGSFNTLLDEKLQNVDAPDDETILRALYNLHDCDVNCHDNHEDCKGVPYCSIDWVEDNGHKIAARFAQLMEAQRAAGKVEADG